MAITEEAFAAVFAAQLLNNLIASALDQLCVTNCKRWESNDREQSGIDLF